MKSEDEGDPKDECLRATVDNTIGCCQEQTAVQQRVTSNLVFSMYVCSIFSKKFHQFQTTIEGSWLKTRHETQTVTNVKIFLILIFLSVTRLSWHNAIKMVSMIIIKNVNFKPMTMIFKNPKNVYLLRRQKYDSHNKIRGQVPWKNVWSYQLTFCLAHQHLEERKGLKYICPYYFTINEVFLSLSTLFTLAPFSIKILATSTLPFIDAKILKGKKT